MRRVAIIAAMPDELGPLVRGWNAEVRGRIRLWSLQRGQETWIAACAGVGSGPAARCLEEIEREGAVGLVLSIGWAGSLRDDFAAGAAYEVSSVIDARTGERFETAASRAGCVLVTSSSVAALPEKRRLSEVHGADLVDMEAAAVAGLAARRGIAFLCVKGISDGPSERLPDFNRFIGADGRFRMLAFVVHALLRPRHWPSLVRMGSNSRHASLAMRDVIERVLDEAGRRADRAG